MTLRHTVNADGTVDLVGKRGTTWILDVQMFQDDEQTTPLPLTGYSARSQVRASYDATTALADFTCTVTDEDNGWIRMYMDASVTAKIPYAINTKGKVVPYYYDMEIYKGDPEEVNRDLQGKLTIDPEVTKS